MLIFNRYLEKEAEEVRLLDAQRVVEQKAKQEQQRVERAQNEKLVCHCTFPYVFIADARCAKAPSTPSRSTQCMGEDLDDAASRQQSLRL